MAIQLTSAHKRSLLLLAGTLIVILGWRLRAAYAASPVPSEATPAIEVACTERLELNAADSAALLTVQGIGPVTAGRIVRYRALIGGFTATEQLLQVWGLSPERYVRIEEQVYVDTTGATFAALRKAPRPRPHARRAQRARTWETPTPSQAQAAEHHDKDGQAAVTPAVTAKLAAPRVLLDINTADSAALVNVPGIGPGTARNIVKYRALIFYYHSLDQLAEVWGVRPENLERMRPHLTVGKAGADMPRLRINELDVEQMGRHRYLGFKEARIVVAYREMHGPFKDMAALRQVKAVDPAKWAMVEPYLEF